MHPREMRASPMVRAGVVIALAIICVAATSDQHAFRRLRIGRGVLGGGANVLLMSDLACVGMFLGPNMETGGFSVNYPTAVRLVGGVPHIFQLDGKGNVYEYLIPTITGNCGTAIGSLAQASVLQSWGTWPAAHSSSSNDFAPHYPAIGANSYAWGLKWDEPTSWLVMSHSPTYNTLPAGANAIAAATLNTGSHTLSCAGEWGITGLIQSAVGLGIIDLPASFLSTYGLGTKRWGVGTGGYTSSVSNGTTANSIGLALRATTPPSGNACPDGTDTAIAEGTTLVRYDQNAAGPTCDAALTGPFSGETIGCTPGSGTPSTSVVPTTPYPQKTAWNKYSLNYYTISWDPYGGFGYVGAGTTLKADFYDGPKKGIVEVLEMPSGWVNTTILASPAPTITGSDVTFSIASTSTHDGFNLQIGDKGWVQTCALGVGDCAEGGNNLHLSVGTVTSVNTGTGAIGFHIDGFDAGSGDHTPSVGGRVMFGGLYKSGAPDISRAVDIIQIIDPTQLGEVAASSRQPYNVVYHEEAEFSTFAAPFGCPGCATPGKRVGVSNKPTAVHALPSLQRILVVFRHATVGIGIQQSLFVVLSAP